MMPIQSIRRTPIPGYGPGERWESSNDEDSRDRWPLARLRAEAAWPLIDKDAREIIVAVVDSGVDQDLWSGVSARTAIDGQTRDDEDHGTLVADTIRSSTGTVGGVSGAAKVRILPVKFCSAQFLPSANRAAKAIEEAVKIEPSPHVIVLAWDVGSDTPELRDAIADAGVKGAVVVIAAGNHSLDNDKYPNAPANHGKSMDHVITVMATDEHDERASFSNYGKDSVYLAAPGFANPDTARSASQRAPRSLRSGRRPFHGTSASAAYVAGLAALILAKNPFYTAKDVKDHLRITARPVQGLEKLCVTGRIADYYRALNL